MPSAEPFRIFTRKLEDLGLRYMVTGSIAAIYYGEPRLTNDIDIVVILAQEDAAKLEAAFPLADFYCPPHEVIQLEIAREQRGHFNLIHHQTGFKADVYPAGRDALHLWALGRTQDANLGDDVIRLAPPEYVVIRKLQFFREGASPKHLRDVNRMLVGLGEEWPRTTLLELVQEYGLEAEWKQALAVSQ